MASGSDSSARAQQGGNPAVDAALALALLLPIGVLLWPSTLQDVPTTQSMATGTGFLLLLPAALLLVARGVPRLPIAGILLLGLIAYVPLRAGAATDAFEWRRTLLVLLSSFLCLLGGLRLSKGGRTWLQVALVLASSLSIGHCAWISEPGGALGNSGDLSEAALPGALLGVAWFAEQRPRFAALGLAAALAFVLHAALVPVWTGAVAFGAASMLALVLSIRQPALGRYGRIGAVTTLAMVLVAVLAPSAADVKSRQPMGEQPGTPTSVSGLEVRRLLWGSVPAILSEHALAGLGPGQFAAAYPPYRDPAEIELSSHGRREPTPIDAEHLHNDWLQGPVDFGILAGGLWVLFLLAAGTRSIAALLGPGVERRGAALATAGVLVGAAGNSPLLDPVASHLIFFPLLGLLLADDGGSPVASGLRSRWLPALFLVPFAICAQYALDLVQHGQALSTLAAGESGNQLLESRVLAACDEALRAAPDSTVALERRANLPSRSSKSRIQDLDSLLELRPHHRGAHVARGIRRAVSGAYELALADFDAALDLDSSMPAALSGAVRGSARGGLVDELRSALAKVDQATLPSSLEDEVGLSPSALRTLGLEVLRRGQFASAEILLTRGDGRLLVSDPNVCWNLGQEARAAGDRALEDALLAGFHLDSARSHLARGDGASAIRSYRQAQRFSGSTPEVLIELSAAQAAAGDHGEARDNLDSIDPAQRAAARPQPSALERLRKERLWPLGEG